MTLLQQVRDAILQLLNTEQPSGVVLPTFTTRRWSPGEQLDAGEIEGAVLFGREFPQRPDMRFPVTKREHVLRTQIVTAVTNPADLDDALEAARAWVVERLGNTTLGGLVHDLEEGESAWEAQKLERLHGAVTTLWRARFQTNRSNLTQRS